MKSIRFCLILALLTFETTILSQEAPFKSVSHITVPPGFVVEVVAAPPLVGHPMMGGFDEQGRLYLAESAGQNLKKEDLLKVFPNFIRVLEPADGKGVFTKGRIWADKMTFPMGVLWHQGALYVCSSGALWKLEDTKNAGVADKRTELVKKFGFTGNAADVHGPFLGPDGRLYWCEGRHGHEITRPDGSVMKGKAARIFRCKTDGSEIEVVCGGGMDNPVEIAFTDECEPFATVDILHAQPARNDAIIYCIEGGVYPYHEVYKEFPRTGDLLPAVGDLGWVAPSGLMRYRSATFGKEYQGNLFSAQFNRNRIQRHFVERDGASFKLKTEDFLVSTNKDFHPTDVLEDADGSLLVIDTGGWFRIGCPTSQIAKPEIKGAIYRVRKEGAARHDDPRGQKQPWSRFTEARLTRYLDDPRFVVRDRVIEELARRNQKAQQPLANVFNGKASAEARRNAIWALTRIEEPRARALVRNQLKSDDFGVRMAAIHSIGLHRDAAGLEGLEDAVEHPAIRRQAATAMGRLKDAKAIPALMNGLRRDNNNDRFLEHALIYALIQIGDQKELIIALDDQHAPLARAALIALDQIPGGEVPRERIQGLLARNHPPLTLTLLEIIAARPGWGSEVVGLVRTWLAEKDLGPQRKETLRGLMNGLAKDQAMQDLVTQALESKETSTPVRLALLESMAGLTSALPPAWVKEVGNRLHHVDPAVRLQAIQTLRSHNLTQFDDILARFAAFPAQKGLEEEIRVRAFAAVAPRLKTLEQGLFAGMLNYLHADQPPQRRQMVATALGQAPLQESHLAALTSYLAKAGPLELPGLLAAFEKNASSKVAGDLLGTLEKTPALTSLSPAALERAFAKAPEDVRIKVQPLIARLSPDTIKQKARLDELAPLIAGGDVAQGKIVFFGPKAACATCHATDGKGGKIGPDLGKIAAIRAGRDLLESLVFPSASFARGYESFVVETKAGQVHTGILARETADQVVLVNAERQEIRVPRTAIEQLAPGRVSIMPQGLDTQLTREELRDLMAFLQSLK